MQAYREIPFHVELPVSFFEKADAPAGKRRRIGGVISTELPDRQGDTLIQSGLDFSDFVTNGWFNDNHKKDTTSILGYPEGVQQFAKGATLPDGTKAKANCTWAEGYLLDNWEPSDKIWTLGKALQGTGRKLGYSVEGSILRRTGEMRKTVALAKVREVAITKVPVNTDTGMQILAKSLQVAESMEPEALDSLLKAGDLNDRLSNIETLLEKALTVTGPGGEGQTNAQPVGPRTGEGAGELLTPQSLLSDLKPPQGKKKKDEDEEEEEVGKSLSDADAVEWVRAHVPNVTLAAAGRFVSLTKALKRRGKL